MRTFIFIGLLTFLSWQTAAGDLPAAMQETWTFAQITNALREVEASWEKSPRTGYEIVCQIVNAKPDEPLALKTLLLGISQLPVPSMEENLEAMWEPLFFKWKTLEELARFTPLGNASGTWEHLASMVGWVRPQIIPDYRAQTVGRSLSMNGIFADRTSQAYQEHLAMLRDIQRKRAIFKCQDQMEHIMWSWRLPVDRIRGLATKMPPEERRQYLDRIKELAHSDEEEAKLIDTPIMPEKTIYPSVDAMRYFLSNVTPEKRAQEIEKARRESNYTEEQLKELEAPYDAPVPSPPVEEGIIIYPPTGMMRDILSRSSPERRVKRFEELRKAAAYSEDDMKILEAPYE